MEQAFDFLSNFYKILLGINVFCYLIVVIKGEKPLKYILLYLTASGTTEILSYLIVHDFFTVSGQKTNAPIFFVFIIIQFLAISFFYKNVLKKTTWINFFYPITAVILIITLFPYVKDQELIMVFTPWAAFITFPVILLGATLYFIDLLDLKKGYPYINIGIFLSVGCSLINFITFGFQEDVDPSISTFVHLLHILPILSLHILFLYQCLLLFKFPTRPSTTLR